MKLQYIERDLLHAFHRALLLTADGTEIEIDNCGEVRRWVRVPPMHSGFPGYWRAPSADIAAEARACLIAAAFPPARPPVPEVSDEQGNKRRGRKRAVPGA